MLSLLGRIYLLNGTLVCDRNAGVVFGYKGVLLLFGILLVYETRSIKFSQINDSRFISMSMCNIVVSYSSSYLHLHLGPDCQKFLR